MGSGRKRRVTLGAALAALSVTTAAALAVGPNGVVYSGLTSQERDIKVVTDKKGVVKRGAFSAKTTCSGQFKPFAADISFDKPLDRSNKGGFREHGNDLETDGTYSGRYKYEIKGDRKGKHKFTGEFDLEIVFRKNDRKYTTCIAENVAYKVKSSSQKSDG
jgi:hypothetical protein